MSKSIPVFLHLPRSGGTYIYSWMLSACWYKYDNITRNFSYYIQEYKNKIFTLNIIDNFKKIFLRMLVYDANLEIAKLDFLKINFENFSCELSIEELFKIRNVIETCEVFCASIESAGIKKINKEVSQVLDEVLESYIKKKYFCFRNPKDRIISIYNYIKSPDSAHELTHDSIISTSLEEYLSSECEDNFIVKNLAEITGGEIKELDFKKSVAILSEFNVETFDKIDNLIKKSLYDCHGIIRNRIPYRYLKFTNRNNCKGKQNNYKKTDLERYLKNLTYWDCKLFDLYSVK